MPKSHKKKAWNKTNPLYRYIHSRRDKHIKGKVHKVGMAKRRRAKVQHSSHRRTGRRGFMGGFSSLVTPLSTIIYGIARPKLSQIVNSNPTVQKALGEYGNEVVLGGGAFVIDKLVKKKIVSDILAPVQIIELASAAELTALKLTQGQSSQMGNEGYVN